MSRTARTAALIVMIMASIVLGISPPALADQDTSSRFAAHLAVDHRPCVSLREYRGIKQGLSRADVEARWDVEPLSITRKPGYRWVEYRACAFTPDEGWVFVIYTDSTWELAVRVIRDPTGPHGHHREVARP